eukprot:509491_1
MMMMMMMKVNIQNQKMKKLDQSGSTAHLIMVIEMINQKLFTYDDDRFALISFDDNIFIHTQSKLEFIKNINKQKLKKNILNIKENGTTNFELAYEKANAFFNELNDNNNLYDNRIIMLTDACAN